MNSHVRRGIIEYTLINVVAYVEIINDISNQERWTKLSGEW